MLFKELTREEDLEISRLDGYDAGEKAGFTKGEQKAAVEIARSMKKEKIAADMISRITGLTMAEVNAL